MWRDSFKIPKEQKTFDGVTYSVLGHTIEVTKQDAEKKAEQHKKNGWKVRIVKFEYQKSQFGYVLYGKR
jgi:hypothetical protein